MKRFDVRRLFGRADAYRYMPDHPYRSSTAELDAVRSGKKGMSYFGMPPEDLVRYGFTRGVFSRRLAMTLHAHPKRKPWYPASVFVARPEELWRVPAKLLEWQGIPGSMDASDDAYGSLLFGYTKAQTKRWEAFLHQNETFCMYTLLTRAQRARVVALGKRCFGTAADLEALTFYYTQRPLERDAHELLPAGQTLARTRLNYMLLRDLLGDWENNRPGPFVSVRPTTKQAIAITDHITDNVELLTAKGWR